MATDSLLRVMGALGPRLALFKSEMGFGEILALVLGLVSVLKTILSQKQIYEVTVSEYSSK